MRFMMLMIPEVYSKPMGGDGKPDAEAIRKMGAYNSEMMKSGIMLTGEGLTPPWAGARVTFESGVPAVNEGAQSVIGGYWMIRVKSREEAIEWAKRCPAGPNDVIELRQVFEPEDFGPDVAREERAMRSRLAGQNG